MGQVCCWRRRERWWAKYGFLQNLKSAVENIRQIQGRISDKYRGEYLRNTVCKVLMEACCGRRRERWWASLSSPHLSCKFVKNYVIYVYIKNQKQTDELPKSQVGCVLGEVCLYMWRGPHFTGGLQNPP